MRIGLAVLLALAAAGAAGAAELRGHGGPVRALAAGEGRAVLSGSFDTRAILWDAGTGAAEQVMQLHEGSVTAVAFLPEGRVATAGQEGRIALWRPGVPEPERVIEAHAGPVTALALGADGDVLASSAWDGTARLTPLGGGEAVVLEGHGDNVNGIAFLPDGRVATAGYDGSVRFWLPDGTPDGVVSLGVPLNALAVDAAGTVWLAAADGAIRAVDPARGLAGEVAVGQAPLVALAENGGTLAAAAVDGSVAIVEADAPGRVARTIPASSGPVWSVVLTGDGTLLAGGADHVVRAWDTATGAALAETGEVAAADALGEGRGAEVFRMCAACHTLDPDDGNRAGPTLHGIFGRPIASAEGFRYSAAFRELDIVWTPETVARLFEIGPAAMTPGTSMPEQRIADPADRAALIAFLEERTR